MNVSKLHVIMQRIKVLSTVLSQFIIN